MNKLENLGIIAGALAVGFMFYMASKSANRNGFMYVSTDGQPYTPTVQKDPVLSDGAVTWL